MDKVLKVLEEILNETFQDNSKTISCFSEPQEEIDEFEQLKDELILIDQIKLSKTYQVYVSDFSNSDKDYYFVDETKQGYALLVNIEERKYGNHVGMVCKNPTSERGIAAQIYVEYFANKMGELWSDETQTALGFKLWQNIFDYVQRTSGFKFVVYDTQQKKEFEVNDSSELNQYYGKEDENFFQHFVIKKI